MGKLTVEGGGGGGGGGASLPFVITAAIRTVFDKRTVPRKSFEVSSKVLMKDSETGTEVCA